MKREIIKTSKYRGYKLKEKNEFIKDTYYKAILDKGIDMLESLIDKHSRLMVYRCDIRSECDNEKKLGSSDMTKILSNTSRQLNYKYRNSNCKNKPDGHYMWAAERTSEEMNIHWHLFGIVNGNAIKDTRPILKSISNGVMKQLDTANDKLVHNANGGAAFQYGVGMRIDRNDDDFHEKMNMAVERIAYMAKTESKDHNPKHSRVFSCSRFTKRHSGSVQN